MHLLRQQILSESFHDQDRKDAWNRQFEIVAACLKKELRACGMEETGEDGEIVDFEIHEVLSASDTEDEQLEGRVAKVFAPGCVYHGNVLKKASVDESGNLCEGRLSGIL